MNRPTKLDDDWMDEAACAGMSIYLFVHDMKNGPHGQLTQSAIAVCNGCPVRAECLQWALDVRDGDAILGGMTPNQRVRYRQALHRKQAS